MVGPVVKIDPATLPRHPNLHYFGQKTYAELPVYPLKGWDVCLLPFARNDSTKFISPTKTLEYMAGSKLMVSTAITDVVEPCGHFVYIGEDTASFIECCEQAIAISEDDRRRRMEEGDRVLAQTSWGPHRRVHPAVDRTVCHAQPPCRSHSPHRFPSGRC